ncbi:hypothetical protein BV898_18407 [Hypsibius exemplaris]|uniref:Metalloendopeptidase n=1 Tax=Hypsibius exemplaris TaxID=2072580 RepID=A0A9X6NIS2_HYPEX|nr:hypothetical protein BV898_18407 [Hypsibius exemplaris]
MGTCIRFKSRTIERDYIEYVTTRGVIPSLDAWRSHGMPFRSRQYIKVNLDNIQPEYRFAYDKLNTNNLKTPYDYKSIMHYGSTFFAIDVKKPTMVSLTPGVTIGRSDSSRMSPIDKQRINLLYQCTG